MKTIIPIAPMQSLRTSGIIASRPAAELSASVQEPPEAIPEGDEEKKDNEDDGAADIPERQANPSPPTSPNVAHPVAQLPEGTPSKECDYDTNPSELYLSIQSKRWPDTISRSASHQEEASTWVSRKERDGKLRWRLLPLHAAIIFKAPEKAVESLLCAFPLGAQCKDDQGMLPIHLAFRNGSSEGVVNLLLVAFPQSIEVKDRKGRIPLKLAQASTSPNREAYIRAIERGPRYYAVAAAATERTVTDSEHKALYEEKIAKMEEEYKEKLSEAMKKSVEEKAEYEERIAEMKAEVEKTQETSQVLVDHVNSLEAQLSTRTDTERFLATKIANLDSSLRETTALKEQLEKELSEENSQLREENESIKATLEEREKDNVEIKNRALFFEESTQKEKEMTVAEKRKYDESIRILQMELDAVKTNHGVVEAQLKKKVDTEATLASQVSELASKLADSASQNAIAARAHNETIEKMEAEKIELEKTVEDLTSKLQTVSQALDFMASEQERIVDAAKRHEETMAVAAETQRQIVANTARQEVVIAEATREREQIVAILQRQAEEVENTTKERRLILEAVQKQHGEMERANKERADIIESVARQRKSMKDVKRTQLAGLPGVHVDESDDEVSIDERETGVPDDNENEGGMGDTYPKICLSMSADSSVGSNDEIEDAGMSDAELAAVDEKVAMALRAHSNVSQGEDDVTDGDATSETKDEGSEDEPNSGLANTTVVIGATDETTNSMEVVGSVHHAS